MSLKQFIEVARPANILSGQLVCDLDDVGGYYGSTAPSGAWCIRYITDTAMLYAFGAGDYATAWVNRATLTYGIPDINT